MPFFEPKPPATQSSSASRATRRVMRGEVPRLLREVLQRDVLELRAVLDEELDDCVRVAGDGRIRGGVLLDQREARAGLGDDEQAPEERAAVGCVRDPHVERLVEDDVARDDDEQSVLPQRGVVRGELLVPADELVEPRVIGERLERDALRRALDLERRLGDVREPGHRDVQHRLRRTRPRDCPWGMAESVRVEALEVGEAPRFVPRRRERQRVVALEQIRPTHTACTGCAARAGSRRGRRRTRSGKRRYRRSRPRTRRPSPRAPRAPRRRRRRGV